MDQVARKAFHFDRFTLDLTRGALRANGADIDLRPKAFEVLRYLVENAGRLVSKDELFEAVWPNVTVSDDSLVQCIRELREKLGDTGHRLIKTVPRRGYLLEAAAPQSVPAPAEPAGGRAGDAAQVPVTASRGSLPRVAAALALAFGLIAALVPLGLQFLPDAADSAGSSIAARQPQVFSDCPDCPEMIAMPAGQFKMGSDTSERGRQRTEGLPRPVTIGAPFALGRFEVTVGQFNAFVAETGRAIGNRCRLIDKIDGDQVVFSAPKASFRTPSYVATDKHPVGCASLHDAQAYAAWLRRRTGKPYRLPTEAEWEYAARAGTETAYSFGDDERQLCAHGQFADLDAPFGWRAGCRSGRSSYGALAVGTLTPNSWGLHDMHGNVWEWVEDCWTSNPAEIPTDGSALVKAGICEVGVLRGGSWISGPLRLRAAYRLPQGAARHDENMGFRVALSLDDKAQK